MDFVNIECGVSQRVWVGVKVGVERAEGEERSIVSSWSSAS